MGSRSAPGNWGREPRTAEEEEEEEDEDEELERRHGIGDVDSPSSFASAAPLWSSSVEQLAPAGPAGRGVWARDRRFVEVTARNAKAGEPAGGREATGDLAERVAILV